MNFFSRYKFLVLSLAVLLGALGLFSLGLGRSGDPGVARYLLEITGPVQEGISGAGGWVEEIFHNYFALVQASRENLELRKEVASYRQKLADLGELELANSRLRHLLELEQKTPYPMMAAELVATDPTGTYHTFIMNKGSSEGVLPRMPVLHYEGLVGRVVWSSPNYSKVLLLTDPTSGVDVIIQRSRAKGVVRGRGDGPLELKYVLHTDDVRVGDKVITSGSALTFPKGILVGTVMKVTSGDNQVFQEILVDPAVSFDRLEEVLVMLFRRKMP